MNWSSSVDRFEKTRISGTVTVPVPDGRMVGVEALNVALLLAAQRRGGRQRGRGHGAAPLVEAKGGNPAVLLAHSVVRGQRPAGGGRTRQPVHLYKHNF
jgi:hypothetical protein